MQCQLGNTGATVMIHTHQTAPTRFVEANGLAVLDLELPQWKLRRIAYDDGEWRCCLGQQWPLPKWLDDTVDVGHLVLPLAILNAMIEARAVAQTSAAVAP
jgi:hypothetical protein